MIRSFRHKGLRRFYRSGSRGGIRPDHAGRLQEILTALDAAAVVSDMGYPTSGLHPLKGRLAGYWAVSVSGNWRVVFQFDAGDAVNVDYLDYH
jgi:proteic killer suppression protein